MISTTRAVQGRAFELVPVLFCLYRISHSRVAWPSTLEPIRELLFTKSGPPAVYVVVVNRQPHQTTNGGPHAKACHGGRALGRDADVGRPAAARRPTAVPKDGSGAKARLRRLEAGSHDLLCRAEKEEEQIRPVRAGLPERGPAGASIGPGPPARPQHVLR